LERGRIRMESGEILFELLEAGVESIVLSLFTVHEACYTRHDFEVREEAVLFAVVVRMNGTVPAEAVVDKVGVVSWFDMRCLLIDAVIAEDKAVVDDCHVGGCVGEGISFSRLKAGSWY